MYHQSDTSYSLDSSVSSFSSLVSNQCLSPKRYTEESLVDVDSPIDRIDQQLHDQIESDSSDDSSNSFDCYIDSEDEEVENDLCTTHLYQPLYTWVKITIYGAICAIMQFCKT